MANSIEACRLFLFNTVCLGQLHTVKGYIKKQYLYFFRKNYKGYLLESRLHFRIHATRIRLTQQASQSGHEVSSDVGTPVMSSPTGEQPWQMTSTDRDDPPGAESSRSSNGQCKGQESSPVVSDLEELSIDSPVLEEGSEGIKLNGSGVNVS